MRVRDPATGVLEAAARGGRRQACYTRLEAVGRLGSIFDEDAAQTADARGPDLRTTIRVPRSALGNESGVLAKVPLTLPYDGGTARRVSSSTEPEGTIRLHLPEDIQSGVTLRLRRQGGESPGGRPGDLFVQVEVVERPWWPWLVGAALALGAAGAAFVGLS